MELYHWARCSTCRATRERLARRGTPFAERDFFADRLTRAELDGLARMAGGARRIFSFASPSFRALARDPDSMTEAEMLDLIQREPRLLRRPLAVVDGRVLVGSREVESAG